MNRQIYGAALIVVTASCGNNESAANLTVRTADSADIAIVTNLVPATDTLTVQHQLLTIGGIDVETEYAFQRISDVAVLPNGSIAVTDVDARRVALFDADGRFLLDLGTIGSGPGGFRRPRSLHLRGDTLAVWDSQLRRATTFTTAGDLLAVQAVPVENALLPVAWLGDSWLDERETGQLDESHPARAFLVRVAGGDVTDTVVGFYRAPEHRIMSATPGRLATRPPPNFDNRASWRVCHEHLVWTSATEARVEFRDLTGRLHKIVALHRPTRPVSQEDRIAFATAISERFELSTLETAAIQDQRFVEELPVMGPLLCGPNQTLWVNHFELSVPEFRDGVGPSWDVIDATGGVIQHVTFPAGFVLKGVTDDRAYGVARRELDVMVVEVYSLPTGRL